MVELKHALLDGIKAPDRGISICYENGLNLIELDKEYIFDFLLLNSQCINEKSVLMNKVPVFTSESGNNSVVLFSIKSKVIFLSLVLLIKTEEKTDVLRSLKAELSTLKKMKLNNDEDKENKIKAIIEIIIKYPLCYVLINQNHSYNYKNSEIISTVLECYRDKATFILLEKEQENEEILKATKTPVAPPRVENNIKHSNKKEVIEQGEKNDNKATLKIKNVNMLAFVLKTNILLLLLVLLEVGFTVFLTNLIPYYIQTNNTLGGIMLIIVSLVTFVIDILYISNSVNFIDRYKGDTKKRFIITVVSLIIATIVGAGIAYGLFFIFVFNNIIVKAEKYTFDLITTSVIVTVVMLIMPLFAKQIHTLTTFLSNKFKR